MSDTSCENCTLRRKASFRPLAPEELKLVSGMRMQQGTLAAGRLLFKAGESPRAFFTLLEGWAGVCPDVPNAPLHVTDILLPGDVVGTQDCLIGSHGHSVIALTRLRYCAIHPSLPQRLAERGGALCLALMRDFAEGRSRRERMTTLLGSGSPSERLAYLFLETFDRLKAIGLADQTMCPFPLRRRQLAEIVGLSEVHVSRTLAAMRKDGLIDLSNNILIISDIERLAGMAKLKPAVSREGRLIL